MIQADPTRELCDALAERILVLDGAMGTTIRTYGLNESDARGERFADSEKDLLNNGDILSLTRPEVIAAITPLRQHSDPFIARRVNAFLDGLPK